MSELIDALAALRDALGGAPLTLDLTGAEAVRRDRTELVEQIDDYLLPRLARLDAPLLVVLAGSTGAGKSTITNSLADADVSAAGVLRPTTRDPVLVCHPDDEAWFTAGHDGRQVLPEVPRASGVQGTGGSSLAVVTSEAVAPGVALLDTPDIDSVEVANHEFAAKLLGAADLWLFVTTASRYADAVPWDYLARAAERSAALAMIVNRVPGDGMDEVVGHLGEMLARAGLADTPVFGIAEQPLDHGRLASALDPVRAWLGDLAADAEGRRRLVADAIDGVVDSIPARTGRIVGALRAQVAQVGALRVASERHRDDGLARIDRELAGGTLLRGEVLDRWREQVGTGKFMERLQRGMGRLADRALGALRGRNDTAVDARGQLQGNLETLVAQVADRTALGIVDSWEATPAGATVLAGAPRGIDRRRPSFDDELRDEVTAWQGVTFGLVRDLAGGKVAAARVVTLGINGIGLALMIVVFAHTGGLTGGETGVAAGTAAVSQALLTAIFGEQAVRDLTRRSRDDLHLRITGLFERDRERFEALLAPHGDVDDERSIIQAVEAVGRARR